MEYVYILDFGGRIKIGRTKDLHKRIRNLETQSGCEVITSVAYEFENAVFVENKMHKIFSKNRGLGEYFFNITFQEIRDTLKTITEDKLSFKERYNNLDKEGKIIYLLKKCTNSYEELQDLYGKKIYMFPKILRCKDKEGIITEKVFNTGFYNVEEMEKQVFNR